MIFLYFSLQVIAKSNVITETEHEAAMQQISYLESHQVRPLKQICRLNLVLVELKTEKK